MIDKKKSNQDHTDSVDNKIKKAKKRVTSLFSVVWFIPFFAMLTGIWLIYDYYSALGLEVTLHISDAEGISVDKTVIKVLNVEVGRIINIQLDKDKNSVVMKARINVEARDLLKEDSQFWVVKARIGTAGVSGLTTLLSGAYIEFSPGKSLKNKFEFNVLDRPPLLSNIKKGTSIQLVGNNDRKLNLGMAILYKNMPVGELEYINFDVKNNRMNYQIFISSPYDQLIGKNVHFWLESGPSINADKGEVTFDGFTIDKIFGAIVFSEPEGADKGEAIDENTKFILYDKKIDVPNIISKNSIYLVAFFDEDIKELKPGANVEYKGIVVGKVKEVPHYIDLDQSNLFSLKYIPVLFYIDPVYFKEDANDKNWAAEIKKSIANGLVATLSSNNVLLGGKYIYLSEKDSSDSVVKPKKIYGKHDVIPTKLSGLNDISRNLKDLTFNLKNLDLNSSLSILNKDLDKAHSIMSKIDSFLNEPEFKKLPRDLHILMNELNETLKGFSPNSVVYQEARDLMKKVDKTLKHIDPFIMKLNEKPNSIIFNGNIKDPQPKRAQ